MKNWDCLKFEKSSKGKVNNPNFPISCFYKLTVSTERNSRCGRILVSGAERKVKGCVVCVNTCTQ